MDKLAERVAGSRFRLARFDDKFGVSLAPGMFSENCHGNGRRGELTCWLLF